MDATEPALTRQLAHFVASTQYEDLPAEVCQQAKKCVADFLGVALGGTRQRVAPILWELASEMRGAPEATVIGTSMRTTRFWAAAVNGSIGHTLELDDGHVVAHGHPAATVIPAALAVAERQRADGRRFLSAVALGYEVNLRIGDGITPEAQYDRGFHAAALVGSIGAAASAAHLLGFDEGKLSGTLGNCCLGPIAPFEAFRSGSSVKDFYGGWPAAVGVWAAILSEHGIEGPANFLEAPRGMLNCVSSSWTAARILEALGERWLTLGLYFKKHAACSLAHTAIDAALELRERLPRPIQEIDSIEVRTHVFADELDDRAPTTPQGAKFSIPFVVACALIRGRVFIDEFTPAAVNDPELRELAGRVSVLGDDEYTAIHLNREDRRPSTVKITFRDGCTVEASRAIARGWPEDPMTDAELRGKYQILAEQAVSSARADRIWEIVTRLDELADVSELTTLLRSDHPAIEEEKLGAAVLAR